MHGCGSDVDELREHEGASGRDKPQKPDSGFRCVWSCDWDRYASQVYKARFGAEGFVEGDVRAVNPDDIPSFDLLCAGFPCQSFSVAGKRKGFKDIRGTLFFEVARIAEAKRPSLLLLENVKGLLSSDGGETFAAILQTLDELGYWAEWQVLNSRHFGVPQNRERVFIVGHLGSRGGREIFPVAEDGGLSRGASEEAQGEGANDGKDGSENLIMLSHTKANIKQRVQNRNETWTLDGTSHKMAVAQVLQTDGYLRSGSIFGTDIPQSGRNIRRLTPVECERLQGFPDGWTAEGTDAKGNRVRVSDTQRYKMLGNAVTVNVIEFLGRLILERCSV
jgi:DNA (cytosine-5)-methyltransferase 1